MTTPKPTPARKKGAKADATAVSTPKTTQPAPISAVHGMAPAAAATPAPKVVNKPRKVITGPELKKKELLNWVVERSGIKKKDAKPVVEAMLAILGEALADNRELNLQPFGKLKVHREKNLSNGRLMIAKVRQPAVKETDS